MNKIAKIFVAFAMSLALFLGTEQKETQAQGMPVIDIQGLLTSVMDYVKDLDLTGFMTELSSWDITLEQYKKVADGIRKVAEVYRLLEKMGYIGETLVNMYSLAVDEVAYMQYLSGEVQNCGNAAVFALAITNIAGEFKDYITSMLDVSSAISGSLKKMDSADPSAIVDFLAKLAKDTQKDIFMARNHFHYRINAVIASARSEKLGKLTNNILQEVQFI